MSTRFHLRTVLVSLCAALGASATLAADIQVGAALGRSDYRVDTAGATRADTRDGAGKLWVGYDFTPNVGVEAMLFDLGRASGTVPVPGAAAVDAAVRVRGMGITGVLSAPIGPVSVYARAGVAQVRARLDASVATGLPSVERSWQPVLGLGVAHGFDAHWTVRGEWERLRARFPGGERDPIDLLSVGLSYRF